MKTIIFILISICTSFIPGFSQFNPETMGEKHNQVVNYLDSYDFTGKSEDEFLDDVFYYTASLIDPAVFADSKGIWGTIWACGMADPSGLSRKPGFEEALNLLQQNEKISASSNTFLQSLVSETENVEDYNAFTKKILELETGYHSGDLPEAERQLVLGAMAVFKQSAAYWNEYYSPDEVTTEGRFSLKCFWCVAKNDLKGAILGFLIGNCLCTKFGVSNPVICGAVGAVSFGALYSWASKVCPGICIKCKKPKPSSYPSWICNLPFLYL